MTNMLTVDRDGRSDDQNIKDLLGGSAIMILIIIIIIIIIVIITIIQIVLIIIVTIYIMCYIIAYYKMT